MLDSFYNTQVANKEFPGHGTFREETLYQKEKFSDHQISKYVFKNTLVTKEGGSQSNESTLNVKLKGSSFFPFSIDGWPFAQSFFLVDHIFARTEFESQFVAVLGQDFLRLNFLRSQGALNGYRLKMPSSILVQKFPLDKIIIHTSGCCLGTGAGYGIHFDNLPLRVQTD